MTAIDETDQRILTMLEADGRATLAQLSQATGLSVSAAQSRVQKLEKRGIIKGIQGHHRPRAARLCPSARSST